MTLISIVTCKGRLAHLEQTLPRLVQECPVVLVDYDCPDKCGDWAEWKFKGRVTVVRVEREPFFHKTRAQNLGAEKAIEMGAEVLWFNDADFVVKKWTAAKLLDLPEYTFAVDLTTYQPGPIAMRELDFVRSGRWDEDMVGWGAEDIEMRLRLWCREHMRELPVLTGCISVIRHDRELRSKYQIGHFRQSAVRNEARLREKVKSWGYDLDNLPERARALMCEPEGEKR